jgi:2-polyprenyl-6-methoxyphenol hydroxylase-like FAD-dependent oxidoreductase
MEEGMYDAIIVGARCAGSPTAMLLARKGYRILLADKARFPSDTISTHVIWPHGAEILQRWGLLDRLAATGCPPIAVNMIFDVGPFALQGGVPDANGGRGGFCPRRTVLDKLLVDAAVESGAELREAFTVEDLIRDDDKVVGIKGRSASGARVEERARMVIGADGVHSFVAKAVGATEYDAIPPLATFYYSYFSGFEAEDIEQYVRDYQGAACFPTNDGLTAIVAVWPSARFEEIRADIEGHVRRLHESAPGVADRLRHARREEKWVGTAGVANYFRKPYGRGWALVGDAGYDKARSPRRESATRSSTRKTWPVHSTRLSPASVQSTRHWRSTTRAATRESSRCTTLRAASPASSRRRPRSRLFAALHGDRDATNQFFSAITGARPLQAFMNPENIGRIVSGAAST